MIMVGLVTDRMDEDAGEDKSSMTSPKTKFIMQKERPTVALDDNSGVDDEFILSCSVAEEGEEGDWFGVGIFVNAFGFGVGGVLVGGFLLNGGINVDSGEIVAESTMLALS
eukprot:CAMPEP_0201729358 /NCGR_PEP_ID=MMETSP0593-20130828/18848_1 /ASSEMBLY_ACC=CAM_ASM_000672 /TAXON_ID=267983 /ORGANISM="Skeletonema japonicum, Strain CCMP2506" /LENGTH=110 /DNA_ID=CAMNT_0048221689 /DNA_START=156 /DNA_END=491 /DNA_ORIENTATION=-